MCLKSISRSLESNKNIKYQIKFTRSPNSLFLQKYFECPKSSENKIPKRLIYIFYFRIAF